MQKNTLWWQIFTQTVTGAYYRKLRFKYRTKEEAIEGARDYLEDHAGVRVGFVRSNVSQVEQVKKEVLIKRWNG